MSKSTKLLAIVIISLFISTVSFSLARADVPISPDCLPGQDPKTSFCSPPGTNEYNKCHSWHFPGRDLCKENMIRMSLIFGVPLLIVSGISVAVLIKIRHKNVV